MITPRTTRAQAASAEVATPSPSQGGRAPASRALEAAVPRARAAAADERAARRDDGGSDDDDDDERAADDGLDDEPTALGQGERAMECCFWHAATPPEPGTDSLADRRFVPLHGHAPGCGRESVAAARAREAAYDSRAAAIRAEVAALVAQTNAHVFDGVVDFIRAHPPADGRVPLAIVATRCNAHDEAHALAQLGAHVRAAGLSRFVAHVRAADCASVHTAIRALANALLPAAAGAAYDGRAFGRPNGAAAHDLAILGRWYAAAAASAAGGGAREPVAVFVADADLLSAEALDDLIYALASASATLPVALVAGVATSADSLVALLPRAALARVRTTRFRLQPALSALDETVRRVCIGAPAAPAVAAVVVGGPAASAQPARPPARRPLGVQPSARAFAQLCDHFLTETLSLASVEHALCLGALRHFSTEPLSFLAAVAPRSAAECARLARALEPFHLACVRALPSVRRALAEAEAAGGGGDGATAAGARAPTDAELRALVGAWLWQLHGRAASFRAALLALHRGLGALAAVAVVEATEAAARADEAAGGEAGAPPLARACLKPMRWQLSLREMYAAALEDVTGVERLLGHLQAELAPQARPPSSVATPYAAFASPPAAAAAAPAALAGGRGPAGLLAFAEAALGALDAAADADDADDACAFAAARDALRAARAKAQALLDGATDGAGADETAPDAASARAAAPPVAPPPPPSREQLARQQANWSAAKRRHAALQPAAAAAAQPAPPSGAARAAAEAHVALGQAVCLLARGCLRPLRAFPLGEAASGAPSSEARALRAWTAPRVREVVREGLHAFALAAPEAAAVPRVVAASTPAPTVATPSPPSAAGASAVRAAMRETRHAPRGREPLTLELAPRAATARGGAHGAGNPVTTVALAGPAPLAAAAASRRGAPPAAAASPATPARAEPLPRERLELPDMLLAHCHFAHAEQRALNLADWFGDFARRVELLRRGAGVHTILARVEPTGKVVGKRKAGKSGQQRRGDAKLRRAGHQPAADKAAAARKAGRAAPVVDDSDSDDDDGGDGGAAGGSTSVAQAADPALLARFIGAVGSIHAHGLVRASTRHPGHVIKMVFDGAAADI